MKKQGPDRLMWWVGGAFAVLISAWTTFIVIAAHHRVPEVPLVERSAPVGGGK